MSFLKNIKRKVGEHLLNQEMSAVKRERAVFNFDQAKSVAVLFDAADPDNYELVKKYVKYMRESKKRVHAVGFFNTKQTSQVEYSKLDYDYFTLKNLNWYQKPTAAFINGFTEDPFDVLINFSIEDSYPLHYIAGCSRAKFKIGMQTQGVDIYDMMIEQPADKNFKYFMQQVDIYLSMINKNVKQNNEKLNK
jgi:hypothetical protein